MHWFSTTTWEKASARAREREKKKSQEWEYGGGRESLLGSWHPNHVAARALKATDKSFAKSFACREQILQRTRSMTDKSFVKSCANAFVHTAANVESWGDKQDEYSLQRVIILYIFELALNSLININEYDESNIKRVSKLSVLSE